VVLIVIIICYRILGLGKKDVMISCLLEGDGRIQKEKKSITGSESKMGHFCSSLVFFA
jgi:hypothetical protein